MSSSERGRRFIGAVLHAAPASRFASMAMTFALSGAEAKGSHGAGPDRRVAAVEGLDVASQGGDERITLQRRRACSVMARQLAPWSVYVTAIASADQTSRLIPYSGPGAALRPIAADPPKRSMSAWRMLASLARESPHRASFTARRGSRTTGTRWAASAKRPAHQDRVEHLGADGHPVGLDLLDDDDVGQARPSAGP